MVPQRQIRTVHNILLLAAFGLLFASPGTAQRSATGTVAGVILTSQTRLPIRGAVVVIDTLGITAETMATGAFRLPGVPVGRHTLTVRLLGYAEEQLTLDIREGHNEVPDITLDKLPIRLSEIHVLRGRTELGRFRHETPGSVHVVARDAMPIANELYGDIHQIIRRVPGVSVQEEDGYGLRPNIGMRGTGSERSSKITLMEDGVLIAPAPYAAPAAYYFPLAGRMDAVEVRKGSSQVKFGPRTVGGAINLLSAPIPDDLALRADVAGGSDISRRLSLLAGDASRNIGWMAQTYQVETDGFKRLAGPGNTGFDLQDYVGKLRFNTNATATIYQEVEFKAAYYDERSDETYLGLTDADFTRDPMLRYAASQLDQMNAEHSQVQLRYFLRPSERVDLTATAYRNDFQRNWYKLQSVAGEGLVNVLEDPESFTEAFAILQGADSDADALRIRANNREYYAHGVQIAFGARLGGSAMLHDVEAGIRVHQDEEDRFQHEDGYQMVSGRMVPTSEGTPGSQANRISDASAIAIYVQDEIAFGSVMVTPGIRYETIELRRIDYASDDPDRTSPTDTREHRVSAIIPGLGASVVLTPALRVFAGVHRGFGPPGPGADTETRPERSINYESGLRLSTAILEAEVIGYYNDYENVLGAATLATGETGAGDLFNGGAVRAFGLETSFVLDPLATVATAFNAPLALSLTYTNATFQTAFESAYEPWGTVAQGDELPYLPQWLVHASWTLRSDRWSAGAEASYIGAMRSIAGRGTIPENRKIDAATVVDVSGTFDLTSWGQLYVGARNVLDIEYAVARRPAGLRPGLPRTLMAGMRIEP
jgi:Fe(3+) dicitrate transport protein